MFKEGRRASLEAYFTILARSLPLVSLCLFVLAARLGAEDALPEPRAGGVVASDIVEPAEFVPNAEQALETELPLPAEGPPSGSAIHYPSADKPPGKPSLSLSQPQSIGGVLKAIDADGSSADDETGIVDDAADSATPEEIKEAQEHINSAHALARSATSSSEYTAIIELCKQGESSTPWVAGRGYFRRLASWAHNRRGEERVQQGQEAEALEDFHQAVKLDPRNWRAAHNRGVSYAQQGDLPAALRDLDLSLRIKPNHGAAYRNRGEAYFAMGEYAEAIEDYTRALVHMPERKELNYLRADAHYRLGQLRDALSDYNASLSGNEHPQRLVGRAGVHAALGDYEMAIQDLDRAIKLDSQDAEAYRAVAWILATCPDPQYRRPDKALVAARHALKLQGNTNPYYFDTLAAAYAASQSYNQAASIQQHAVRLAAGTEEQEELQTRLALYRQHRAYVSGQQGAGPSANRSRPAPPASRAAGPAGIRQPSGLAQPR